MSDIIIVNKQQRLIVDPPSRTISVHDVGPIGPVGIQGPVGPAGPTGPVGEVSNAALTEALAPLPKGVLKHHSLTASFTTTGTHTTLQDEGLTCTLTTEPSGRMLKFIANLTLLSSGGANQINVRLLRNGALFRDWWTPSEALSGGYGFTRTFIHFVPSSIGGANVVYKLQIKGIANTAVMSYANANEQRQLFVEDLGAAVA